MLYTCYVENNRCAIDHTELLID